MGLFAARCPVDAREQRWIDSSMAWFRKVFGAGPLHQAVVLPTVDFFPGARPWTARDIPRVVAQVCRYAGVGRDRLDLEIYGGTEEKDLAAAAGLTYTSESVAGHYRRVNGRPVIGIDSAMAATPEQLVATIAHELGHARLDDDRIDAERGDHEPLTDLLTVYLGLGVFTANASFDVRRDGGRESTSRLGYLTEPMFGYGLARYAWMRGEHRPDWAAHLDTNPRAYLKRGLRYLAATGGHEPR
ncbi:MAG TPA: hypothetical protein VM677_24195 [Actinokineospora sp.]|jgi:hypothetical protein|nr:hypothetical protein [Actinokineospora sp.]